MKPQIYAPPELGCDDRPLPAYAAAFARLLEHYALRIRMGESPSDIGAMVEAVAIAMSHRT